MEKYNIEFYEMENGVEPAKEFIESLEPKILAKVLRILDLLEENGPAVRLPYSKHLEGDIFEIRAKQGNNNTRVLYFFVMGKKIILTNGFTKKTQKTPKKEIVKANRYREDYKRRYGV